MSYFESPANLEMIRQIVRTYASAGVESIFSWTYRAGQGTILSAPNPREVWDLLGEAYGEVLEGKVEEWIDPAEMATSTRHGNHLDDSDGILNKHQKESTLSRLT